MLARRLVWALISEATKAGAASMIHYMVLISARLVLLTLCGWVLCWTLVNLFRSHSVLNLLFLGYPDTQRERQRHRQREKQAPCREPDVGLDPGSPGSHPRLQAALNRCATGAACICYFSYLNLCLQNDRFIYNMFGVYVPLCCFHQDSRAHLLLTDYNYMVQQQAVEESASTVGGLAKSKDFLSLLLESLKEQFNNATPIPTHSCPLSPDLIRNEVECLKADFNHRIKEVLFNSLFSAYYVAFLPLCFVKSTQYYDMRWSCEHLIMVWINAFVMLTTQLLPSKYCDLLHKSAAHLGKWQKLEHGSYSNAPQHIWSENTIWPQGVLVRHSRCLYRAMGPYNVAVPSDVSHARFYFLFHRPLRLLNLLILIEGSVVFYQLYSLLRSEKWNHTLSMALILFCNYYVLFKLLRDRIVLGRAYSYPLNSYELKAN
ncbi:transmembrane protein 39A isoform X3 [Canis lupus baileyi]|nr:transmembrane protein 39A isoform X3 [Canis lupus dingo]